ncbi:hypothetical protein [Corallococcus sp. CA054B]|uniref:hypothetical protein n=1 Tax=Corallococcus sp. CA054B TaxID=2316734 RepID=UPI001F325875|nr:hypothetical protein [Corallococcus sp. CA054B]
MTHMPRWFALLPLPAILLGAFVARRSGVPATAFAVNALAAALGVGVAALVGRLSDSTGFIAGWCWGPYASTLPPSERARASGGQEWALPASLVVYIAATLGVTTLGNFPVPVMGAGAGLILGWYAATGILAAAWATARVSSAAA